MDLGLKDKIVFVTGGSGGIGRALAQAFGAEGARVALSYNTDEAGANETVKLAEAAGGQGLALPLDQGDEASIDAAIAKIKSTWGDVAVLVNNAVVWPGRPEAGTIFETASTQTFRDSLRYNLEGPYLLSRAVIGGMRAAGWGRIIHISSGIAEDGRPGSSAYAAAKAGLHGLTRTMSRELASAGIFTNVVMAGFTDNGRPRPQALTDMMSRASALGRISQPEDMQSIVVYLGSAANVHVTGELIRADGHTIMPI